MTQQENNDILPEISESSILIMRLSDNGFHFFVFDNERNKVIYALEKDVAPSLSLTANLRQAYRDCDFLRKTYKEVKVVIDDKRFTHVPLEWFEDEQAEQLFSYNFSPRDNEVVLYHVLQKDNVVVLFGIDKSTRLFLCEQYPQVRFYAQAGTLCETFSAMSRQSSNQAMYVCVGKTGMYIFGYEHGHLLLANAFDCEQHADRLYYITYCWEQADFDQEEDTLFLASEIDDEQVLQDDLRRYIRNIQKITSENIYIKTLLCE